MPIYEYRCGACGRPEERLERMDAPQSHDCPDCGAREGMRRQLSVAAVAVGAAPAPAMPACGSACPSGGCPFAN